ncbi:cation-translocating P-type ATPase [Ornithinimicrobium sp. F0845]|uniref:heavy metal translocating P-type ATPase n=1 Tax=Ornithinimicrobium sp. F0845 TaxID=2926412 RepID=UPI001FF59399|nr:cation-translocating P-type ATPase [Ornithinimicrobium sp. F0845]MCK0110678.1 cation-translocating P-type ATPase [Ornithinimicrobium sp. F0845]
MSLSLKARTAAVSGALLLLALALHLSGQGAMRDVSLVVASVLAGAPIAVAAWRALRVRTFSIDLLVTIAVTGALIIGEFVESAVVSFLFVFGSYLEARTMDRTRRSLRELVDLAPQEAEVVRDGATVTVPVDDVEVGERVIVRSGGRVPVDGTVTHGTALVDEATITGEPVPVSKGVADQLWSGTVLDTGYLELTADRVGEDTTFAQIIELVEDAQDSKASVQRFLDRFAAIYTPAIVVGAVLTFLISRDLRLALTFLVIACPGALVISTPVSLVAGLGNAARHGALIKGGDAIERLARVDTLVLDKTGTLTVGRPEVTDVISEHPAYSPEAVLTLAAAVEQASEHPLGRTIVEHARDGSMPVAGSPDDVEVVVGRGIVGTVTSDGVPSRVAVGTSDLLTTPVSDAVRLRAVALEQAGHTVVHVGVDGQLVGLIAIADRVRPEAAPAIDQLRRHGIDRFVMLTGDNEHTARAVADVVGIDEVHAGLLPQDKVRLVTELKEQGRTVAMVGDGINDAPAIATADLGLAMGAGTDVSVQTADVILVGNRFDQLLQARSVARATVRNMTQNTAIALGTVAALVAGVLLGVVFMASGMLVHEISVLVVILNAVRLVRHREPVAAQLHESRTGHSRPVRAEPARAV